MNPRTISAFALASLLLLGTGAEGGAIDGTFIQLHRGVAERSAREWQADFKRAKELGGTVLIVQWTAEEPILYFQPAGEAPPRMTETYPTLERIFDAAEAEGMELIIGLQHSPEYWEQIKSRDKVVRDFFRLRMARNERVQKALLATFGDRAAWTGYYIPDEIDDLSWRAAERLAHLRMYLQGMTGILRRNDPARFVTASSFFRGRTAPDLMAANLMDIVEGSGLDVLLVQDGIGVGDPPIRYVPLYFDILARIWNNAAEEGAGKDASDVKRGPLPSLWCVIETFRQTSDPNEPFAAVPAPAARLAEQIRAARPHFERLILFTYSDYLNPDLGDEAKAGFGAIRDLPNP